ncbi:MAG: hypothetical protein M3Q36_01600 [bacterium]|nr:hypothetical protein [bacterium]
MIKKLYTSQTGIAHMVLILVLVLASVGGVGYVVWSKQKKSGTSTNSQSATQKQLAVECKKEIDDKDFCKFASNWNLNESYKLTVTSADSAGSSWLIEGNNNDSRVVMTDNGTVIMETISIGNTTYMKNVGG